MPDQTEAGPAVGEVQLLPNGIQFSIHECPKKHTRELQTVFRGLELSDLLVIPTCQRSDLDLVRVGDVIEDEKDRLLEKFVIFAKSVCAILAGRGYWADYIDPCSGLPMIHREYHNVYSEVDGLSTLLGYKTSNAGCCKILLHPEWGTSVYPASLFAKAPLETVQEAIKHAAAASGQKHPFCAMMSKRAAALPAAAVLLALAVRIGSRLVLRWRRAKRYDGLDSIVSYSSRIIAAMRAIEDEEPDKLFDDPLARVLAGEKAIKRVSRLLQEADVLPGTIFEGSPLPRRVRRLTRTVIRTRWFDDGLLAALSPAAHPRPLTAQLAAAPEGGGVSLELGPSGAPIRQVVLLGAGMDSRAWRLALPPGVKWFEIDRLDVLHAKRRALEAAGATFGQRKGSAKYPLKASAWIPLEADLREAGWSALLVAAGFRPELPAVWLAEGLLMYLQPPAVDAMLREMAGASAHGSVLLTMSVTEAVVEASQTSPHSLVRKFVFGCKTDPRPWLAGVGWHTEEVWTRPGMIKAWGIPAEQVSPQITQVSAEARSLFIIATNMTSAAS